MTVKKKVYGLTLVLALLFSAVAGVMFVKFVRANPVLLAFLPTEPDTSPLLITVHSPILNQTCYSQEVILNFTVTKPETWFKLAPAWDSAGNQETLVQGNVTSYRYEIDGVESQSIPVHDMSFLTAVNPDQALNFSINLTLPEGTHSITVSAEGESYYVPSDPISGGPIVNAGVLSIAVHGASEVINFTVAKPSEPEPFPTTLVIAASGASIAIIGVGLLVYFKKRKR